MLPAPPMRSRLRLVLVSLAVATGAAAVAVAQPVGSDEPAPPGEDGSGSGSDVGSSEPAPAGGSASGSGSAAPAAIAVEPPAPVPAPPKVEVAADVAAPPTGFVFGSYGRVLAGSDLRGGRPEPVAVVAHGPRIVERSYLELDLQYRFIAPGTGLPVRTVTTVAFDDTLFHETGEFDAHPALRNFFLEVGVTPRLTAWGGSRMYRGDDIYLFDYWPLDDQNTLGAGARYRIGKYEDESWYVSAHVGWNRLLDEFQFQEITVPDPEQGATTVTQLNRQRTIASATLDAPIVPNGPADFNLRGKLHLEIQALPSGTRERDDGTRERLPADKGFTVGFELAAFGMAPSRLHFHRHANLFARYSRGLAAFDELAPPTSFDQELKTYPRASELVVGLSGNWDHQLGHVLVGALTRRFVDADRNTMDRDDGWEYAVDVRPLARAWRDLYGGVDLSYQVRFPRGLNPTSQRASDPAIFQLAPMLVWSPLGSSGYSRPQLRAVYRAARLNDGARDLYAPDDPRHDRTWVHFLGIQAEWWFNSASYR